MTRQSGPDVPPVERRVVLLGAAGVLLGAVGCTSGSASHARSTTAIGTPSPSASRTGSPLPALPRTTPWRPTSAEIDPVVKLRAVQLVEAIGAWPTGKGGSAAAKVRVAALRFPT